MTTKQSIQKLAETNKDAAIALIDQKIEIWNRMRDQPAHEGGISNEFAKEVIESYQELKKKL